MKGYEARRLLVNYGVLRIDGVDMRRQQQVAGDQVTGGSSRRCQYKISIKKYRMTVREDEKGAGGDRR